MENTERLRAELSAAQAERDRFRGAPLAAFAAEEFYFTREEALAAVDQGPSFRELISELERAEPPER